MVLALLAAADVGAAGAPAAEQPATENSLVAPSSGEPELTPEVAMACFSVLEGWLREWKTPSIEDVPEAARSAVQGVSITLRKAGEIEGRGTTLVLAPELGQHPLVTAAKQAMQEASERMPGDRDALWQDRMRATAPELMISLEVCSAPVTMAPLSYSDVDRDLGAGLDGVAVRIGSRVGTLFPATMVTRSMSPGDGLASCVSVASDNPELGIRDNPVTQPPALVKTHEAVFYRFRPLHVAQVSPGGPGRFLQRSGRVIPGREITTAQMREWAGLMADRLITMAVDEPADVTDPPHPGARGRICLKLRGPLMAATAKIDPEYATGLEQSIAAIGLGRFSRLGGAIPGPARDTARNGAVRMLRDTIQHAAGGPLTVESDQDWIGREIAYRELLGDLTYEQKYEPWHAERGTNAIASWDPTIRVKRVESLEETSARNELDVQDRARLAYAMALRKDPKAGEHVRAVYRELGISRLQEGMPWLGWADLAVAAETKTDPSTAMLREWRDAVYARMAPPGAPGADNADLAGGFVWNPNLSRMPTSDSAGTTAFLATMLRDPRFTDPSERPKELSRLLAAVRFLRQLTMDEFSSYSAQDRQLTLWGVRKSPTELELRPGDSGMTLIAVCETLKAIDGMTKKSP